MGVLIGVTGSIAAGKSYLCSRLAERHGAVHIDADREVHRMYEPGTAAFDRIVGLFGAGVVGADGTIDRKAVGELVFGNPSRMQSFRAAIGDIPAHFMALLRSHKA